MSGNLVTIFPVQKVAHGFSTGLIQFTTGVGLYLADAAPRVIVFAARWAAIRETWLAGSQLKLLGADAANSNWKSHWNLRLRISSMIFDEMTWSFQICPKQSTKTSKHFKGQLAKPGDCRLNPSSGVKV